MSFLSSSRCVLILGDEGLQIYNVGRLSVKFIDFVPWETDGFEISVRDHIIRGTKRSPVVILNDMVEQHYRKERIPKVSLLDRANVLKRRLNVAFPNYKVRAALKLSDKNAKRGDEGKGNSYLFAAIPASDSFKKVMEAVRLSGAPIIGFYLLPIESAPMVKAISAKSSKGSRYKPVWTIFMGQHHNGGLRQIVTRNGELALTRMTPIVDTDIEVDLWSNEVAQELNGTMTYLARFGYKEADGLEVIIIANEDAALSLERAINVECDLKIMNAQEAAKILGLNLGIHDDFRYADPIHAAFLGKKKSYVLPMQSPAIDSLTKPRKVASLLTLLLLIGVVYLGITGFSGWQKNIESKDALVVAQQQNSALKEEYAIELEKKKALGFDFLFVDSAIKIFEKLENEKLKPLPVIKQIGLALGTDLHLDKLKMNVTMVDSTEAVDEYSYKPEGEEDKKPFLEAVMTISFPNTVTPDVGVDRINNLKDRLQNNLKGYEVSIIKQIADLSYTGNFVGGTDEATDNALPEKYDAEIKIWGPIQ